MREYLLVSHGELAYGFKSMLSIIYGESDNLHYFNAYTEDDNEEGLSERIQSYIDKLDENSELIILSDLLGGSVNTEAMNFLTNRNVHVVAGVNAILVLMLLTASEEEDTATLIERVVKDSKEGIVYCNETIEVDTHGLDNF